MDDTAAHTIAALQHRLLLTENAFAALKAYAAALKELSDAQAKAIDDLQGRDSKIERLARETLARLTRVQRATLSPLRSVHASPSSTGCPSQYSHCRVVFIKAELTVGLTGHPDESLHYVA